MLRFSTLDRAPAPVDQLHREVRTMRFKQAAVALALLLSCWVGAALAVEFKGDEAKKDLEKFQGSWILVTGEVDGDKVADNHAGKSKITWEGDKITVLTPHQHKDPIVAEITRFDATKTPKEMHFIRKTGPGAGKPMVGIYEFDGDHLYHFVFDPTGGAPPKGFAAKKKTGHIKHSWKRVKL